MTANLWHDWLAWWDTVPPAFAFLLSLPVIVAALGLLSDAIERRRRSAR